MEGNTDALYPNAEYCKGYSEDVDAIREREYPSLKGACVLYISGYC